MILAGVDAGGSSTRAVAVSEEGRQIGSARGGPAALHERSPAEAAQVIAAVIAEAARREPVEVVVAGVSGAADPGAAAALQGALQAHGIGTRVQVVADAAIALEGALPGQAGIVVIAGTGSVAWGRDKAGTVARAGGWGYLLDRGSGVDIGRRVLQALLRSSDEGAREGALALPVAQALGVGPGEIAHAARSLRTADLAALAAPALDAATSGDTVAMQIINGAAEQLALMARVVWDRLGLRTPHPVVGVGGLFSHQVLREAFRAAMGRHCPGAEVRRAEMPPVGGALWVAFALIGRRFPATLAAEIAESR